MLPKKVVGRRRGEPLPSPMALATESEDENLEGSVEFKPFERVEKLHPGELLELAPRLAAHVDQRYPDWSDIVDAGGNICATNWASPRPFGARPADRRAAVGVMREDVPNPTLSEFRL